MKGFLTVLSAIALSGAALSAQEADTTTIQTTPTTKAGSDTLVVIVKHEGGFFDKVGRPFRKGYKAVENGVVKGYKAVENGFVNGYQAVEDTFVQTFTDTVTASINYRRHYRADIELWCGITDTWGITTSHGYSFGNGLYVGGGTGFAAEFVPDYKSAPNYLIPVFADIKYSFINRLASPFVSLKAGTYVDVTNKGMRALVNPAVGIDIGRFAVRVGYEYQTGFHGYDTPLSGHRVKCGVAFAF